MRRSVSLPASIALSASDSAGRRSFTVEPLESRRLLAVDLSASILSTTVPASLVSNAGRSATLTLSLRNVDTVAAPRNTPKVAIQVKLVPSGQTDGAVIGTVKSTSVAGLSSASAVRKIRVAVKVPRSTPDGTYSLVAVVDPTNKLGEASDKLANNTGTLADALKIAAPFSQLRVVKVDAKFPAAATSGSRGTVSLTLTNAGNVAASGTVSVKFFGVRAGSNERVLMGEQSNVPVRALSPGRNSVVAKNIAVTVPTNAVPASTNYTVFAQVDATGIRPGDASAQQGGTAISGTVETPITLPPVARTSSSPLVPGLGSTLTFTSSDASPLLPGTTADSPTSAWGERGSVVDNLGRSGTYIWTFLPAFSSNAQADPSRAPDVLLILNFPAGSAPGQAPFATRYRISYASLPVAFTAVNGKSLAFGVADSASLGLAKFTESSGTSTVVDAGVTFALAPT